MQPLFLLCVEKVRSFFKRNMTTQKISAGPAVGAAHSTDHGYEKIELEERNHGAPVPVAVASEVMKRCRDCSRRTRCRRKKSMGVTRVIGMFE
jgi:hypothetical protein